MPDLFCFVLYKSLYVHICICMLQCIASEDGKSQTDEYKINSVETR